MQHIVGLKVYFDLKIIGWLRANWLVIKLVINFSNCCLIKPQILRHMCHSHLFIFTNSLIGGAFEACLRQRLFKDKICKACLEIWLFKVFGILASASRF